MNVLFIISASIAIKRCSKILDKLTKKKVFIDCIITENAKKMANLKDIKEKIKGKVYSNTSSKNKMLHIELTRKADIIIVCPATANIIAKYSNGFADDLASTALITSNKQIIFVPAMNVEMWNNNINKNNVSKLKKLGVDFIGPEHGRLSCGEIGPGRLSNVNKICDNLLSYIKNTKIFNNKTCLITAGPTIESIDPVRYISNHSSGKQGYEIAKQMTLAGAKVILISGPTNVLAPHKTKLIKISSADEMTKLVRKNCKVDIAIFVAAVSDTSPKKKYNSKIKKEKLKKITLKQNKDILKEISTLKKNRPKIVVGFAAETSNHIVNAKKKLLAKKCDAIVVNKINKKNKVFGSDFNKVSFITKNYIKNLKKMSKINVAKEMIKLINNLEKKNEFENY